MSTARAVVLDKPHGTFSVQEFPVPELAPGTVLLRMELSGCCATDAHTYLGQWKNVVFPALLGHENVGTVVATGPGGQRDYLGHELQPGDRVFARWGWCGQCYECRTLQQPRRCRNRAAASGASPGAFSGGFAEYLYLSQPDTTFMLKMDAPPGTVVLSEPLGVAVTAVRRAAPKLGETIVVQGCGAIGLLTLGLAKQAGATRAIVVGGPGERLEVAREFGADVVIDIDAVRGEERTRAVLDETLAGLGADLVFGCVGLAPAWLEGISYVRDGGRFMELGLASDTGDVTFNPCTQLVAKNISLMGTLGLENYQDALAAGRILEAGRLPFERMVSHQLPLERVGDAIEALNSNYQVDGQTALKITIAPNGPVA
ncbi:MAG: alcohol dehydrogenase catalytic domain-containing protein [Chloroflexota bacterium]|nr:alcohol dehydrogenase catalytic domain-containing protein [Chloroflexota bacterium]